MRRTLPLLLALALGLLVGRFACAPAGDPRPASSPEAEAPASLWTCSMHPQIQLPDPGACPLCAMDLIPLAQDADDGLHPRQLRVSENAAALAGLVTAPARRRAAEHEVRLAGRVAFDDTRLAYITAWVPSRIDRLFVDSSGVRVRTGDHLVEVYSPELITTQQELLSAVRSVAQLADSTADAVRERYEQSVVSARERLRSWGLLDDQVDAIVAADEPSQHVIIRAPVGGVVVEKNALVGDYLQTGTRIYTIADLTSVWVVLDAYESDLAWLAYGQQVAIEVDAYPGETFAGRISLIDPVLDDRTRTVKVRVHVDNADLRLKPDMFVRARVSAPLGPDGRVRDADLTEPWMCPMHPEVVSSTPGATCQACGMDLVASAELGFEPGDETGLPLVIPASAPLLTGDRAVVYVRVPGDGPPVFEGRQVVLGPRAGDLWVVREGLRAGEQVVVQGAFKLDSELQIRARPSMLSDVPRSNATRLRADPAFVAGLGQLLPPLVRITDALAADDGAAAREAVPALGVALEALEEDSLEGPAQRAWSTWAKALSDGLPLLADEDVARQRAGLRDVTEALLAAQQAFGWTDDRPAADRGVFFCPMAFDDQGARWIGAGETVANPYFGASMLRCGERQADLPRGP